jgi:3-hydroxyacyl-[acyl-carrier-protein] dehydratase
VRFHFVDRIDHYVAGKEIAARKLTSADEEYWVELEGETVMPPVLVLESLCQAGAWLVFLTTGGKQSAALLSVAEVEFGDHAKPGDTLQLDGTVESMDDERAVLSGTVSVRDRVILRARDIMCTLMPTAQLDDPERVQRRAAVAMRAEAAR